MRSICKKGSATLVAVLALCALAAASASASQWYVGGKALSGSEKLAETVKVEQSIVFSIHGGSSAYATITCTKMSARAPSEITSSGAIDLESLGLGGCVLVEKGNSSCELSGSTLTTYPLEAKLSLGTSPEDGAELTPKSPFAPNWLEFKVSECNLLGEADHPISGTLALKLAKGQTEAVEQEFVGEGEASKGLYGFNSKEPIYVTGKFKLKLASGKAWSFH